MDTDDNWQEFSERMTVLRAQSGDRDAFNELVNLYEGRLMYYVRRMIPDAHRARDIFQEVWLDVFLKLGQLRSPEAFRVWLYRLAHDRAARHVRRKLVEANYQERASSEAQDVDSWNELKLLENCELVHAAIEKLSVLHREVVTLRFLEEMNIKEIAEVVNCNEGTAKSRLHNAKSDLRRIILECGYE
jgi:RNA polymerase sigma-70 factor, ECF subfamily